MSGKYASRGYICQSIVAMLECLNDNTWERIKVEPYISEDGSDIKKDKVDISLEYGNRFIKFIQVKSSINKFEGPEIKCWMEDLYSSGSADQYELILVGTEYTEPAKRVIAELNSDGKCKVRQIKMDLTELQDYTLGKIVSFEAGISPRKSVSVQQADMFYQVLFSKLMLNSAMEYYYSRDMFIKMLDSVFSEDITFFSPQSIKENATERWELLKRQCPLDEQSGFVEDFLLSLATTITHSDDEKRRHRKLTDILKESTDSLVLVGTGGSGKSTMMLHAYHELLRDEKIIPIYIPVYAYRGDAKRFLTNEFLKKYVAPNEINQDLEEGLENYLMHEKSVQYCIFIDGLNETSSVGFGDIYQQIEQWSEYPCVRLVISNRYDQGIFKGAVRYYVNGLSGWVVHARIHEYYHLSHDLRELLQYPLYIKAYLEVDGDNQTIETGGKLMELYYNSRLNKLEGHYTSVSKREYAEFARAVVFDFLPWVSWIIEKEKRALLFTETESDQLWDEWRTDSSSRAKRYTDEKYGFLYTDTLQDLDLFLFAGKRYNIRQYVMNEMHVNFFSAYYMAKQLTVFHNMDVLLEEESKQTDHFLGDILEEEQAGYKGNSGIAALLKEQRRKYTDRDAVINAKLLSVMRYSRRKKIRENLQELDLRNVDFYDTEWTGSDFTGSTIDASRLIKDNIGHNVPPHGIGVSENGKYLVSVDWEQKAVLWQLPEMKAIGEIPTECNVPIIGVRNDGCAILFHQEDERLGIYEVNFFAKEEKLLTEPRFPNENEKMIPYAVSADGNCILLFMNGDLILYFVSQNQFFKTGIVLGRDYSDIIATAAVSNDGHNAFLATQYYDIVIVDFGKKSADKIDLPLIVHGFFFNDEILFVNGNGEVFTLKKDGSVKPTGRIKLLNPLWGFTIGKIDGKYISYSVDMLLTEINAQEVGWNTPISTNYGDKVKLKSESIALSKDHMHTAICSEEGLIRVYSTEKRRLEYVIPVEIKMIKSLQWSCGSRFLGWLEAGSLRIYDTQEKKMCEFSEKIFFSDFRFSSENDLMIVGYNISVFPAGWKIVSLNDEDKTEKKDEDGIIIMDLETQKIRRFSGERQYQSDGVWMPQDDSFFLSMNKQKQMLYAIDATSGDILFSGKLLQSVVMQYEVSRYLDLGGEWGVLLSDSHESVEVCRIKKDKPEKVFSINNIQQRMILVDCCFTDCKFINCQKSISEIKSILYENGAIVD